MKCLRDHAVRVVQPHDVGSGVPRGIDGEARQRRARHVGLASLGLVLALAQTAWGGPPVRGAPDGDVAVLVRIGDRSRLEGRFADAEASYRAALALRSDETIALRFALSLTAQGKALEAAPWLSRLAEGTTLSADARTEAARALADAKRELATIDLRASLPGAAIDVDGAPAGVAPIAGAVFVEPGIHTFRASLAGFLTAQASLDAATGRAYVIHLELVPDPAMALRWIPLAPSARRASAQEEASISDYFVSPGGPVRAIGLGLALTMGVGGAAALGIGSENDHLIADYKRGVRLQNTPSCFGEKPASDLDCQRIAQAVSASRNANTAGAILLAGAGVGAAVALISFFLLPPPSFQAGRAGNGHSILTLSPAAGLTFGGLSLEATW